MTESSSASLDVSVVIPVLNAARYLPELLDRIGSQLPTPPVEIILIDSSSTDNTAAIAEERNIRVVSMDIFSHGKARNMGAQLAVGDIVVFMTQDCLPRDESWLAALTCPFHDARVAAAYSRQIAKSDASPMESFFLQNHFPASPAKKRIKQPGEKLDLSRVFFSNVSSAIKRDLLLKHPFDESLIMSEDQQVSRDLLEAGWAIMYVPDSVVIHSHNYTLKALFKRYFDSVYSLTVIFPRHGIGTSASIGLRYLLKEFMHLSKNHPGYLPYWVLYSMAKIAGTLAGHFERYMPRWMKRKLSMHNYHW